MMAKSTTFRKLTKKRIRRMGTHAKCGTARLKSSKNYKKPYHKQGRV